MLHVAVVRWRWQQGARLMPRRHTGNAMRLSEMHCGVIPAGAPCGVRDQMTAALTRADRLLAPA